jgi:hypothetical protein
MEKDTTKHSEPELITPFACSIAESLESLKLPMVYFTCGEKELAFIFDTGSDGSHINRSVVEELNLDTFPVIPREGKVNVVSTGNGIMKASNERCKIKLSLADFDFNVEFSVENLDQVFNFIRENDGVLVHGILGVDFLRANNWTIDFANEVAYPAFKKKQSA